MSNPHLQPLNDIYLERLAVARDALIDLRGDGFHAVGVDLDHGAMPTITVEDGRRCGELVASGQAANYKWARGAGGRESWWQWHLKGCRVVWRDRSRA